MTTSLPGGIRVPQNGSPLESVQSPRFWNLHTNLSEIPYSSKNSFSRSKVWEKGEKGEKGSRDSLEPLFYAVFIFRRLSGKKREKVGKRVLVRLEKPESTLSVNRELPRGDTAEAIVLVSLCTNEVPCGSHPNIKDMAKTSAERQKRYRDIRQATSDEKRIVSWVTFEAHCALTRLAKSKGSSRRSILEELILAADTANLEACKTDEELEAYLGGVTH